MDQHTRTPPRLPVRTPSRPTPGGPGSRVRRPISSRQNPSSSPVPSMPRNAPPKTLYFIRHGQSLAQAAGRPVRLTDMSLLDCALSPLGVEQSRGISHLMDANSVQLVLCSPLTRALQVSGQRAGFSKGVADTSLCTYHKCLTTKRRRDADRVDCLPQHTDSDPLRVAGGREYRGTRKHSSGHHLGSGRTAKLLLAGPRGRDHVAAPALATPSRHVTSGGPSGSRPLCVA